MWQQLVKKHRLVLVVVSCSACQARSWTQSGRKKRPCSSQFDKRCFWHSVTLIMFLFLLGALSELKTHTPNFSTPSVCVITRVCPKWMLLIVGSRQTFCVSVKVWLFLVGNVVSTGQCTITRSRLPKCYRPPRYTFNHQKTHKQHTHCVEWLDNRHTFKHLALNHERRRVNLRDTNSWNNFLPLI